MKPYHSAASDFESVLEKYGDGGPKDRCVTLLTDAMHWMAVNLHQSEDMLRSARDRFLLEARGNEDIEPIPTNAHRADRVEKFLLHYATDDTPYGCLTDLLADARHWCRASGRDFDEIASLAERHFEAETIEGRGDGAYEETARHGRIGREGQAERIAEFRQWIEERRGDAGWANATEEEKLREIYWESRSVSLGLTVPGAAVLAAVEQNVDLAGLLAVQREMLQDIRLRLDSGELDASLPEQNDRIQAALEQVVDVGLFEGSLRIAKDSTDRPWAGLSEDLKAGRIIEMARDSGVWTDWWEDMRGTTPGAHVLETIEREVDYAGLSPWRRDGLEMLREEWDAGEFDIENPNPAYRGDHVGQALRLAELGARIEDFKHIGEGDPDPGRYRRWGDMPEEVKHHEILREMRALSLESEPAAYAIAVCEVDKEHLPPETRREFDDRLFDLAAANLHEQWYDDGLGEFGGRWEERPAFAKVAFLADSAGAFGVSRERFAAAARPLLGIGPDEKLTPEQEWFVVREYRQAIDRYGHGRAERVEEQLRALKDRADFVEPANYEDFADGFQIAQGWVSIGHSWDRLTDAQKIDQIRRSTEFDSLRPGEKRALLARELALTRLPWEGRLESEEAGAGSWPDHRGDDIEPVAATRSSPATPPKAWLVRYETTGTPAYEDELGPNLGYDQIREGYRVVHDERELEGFDPESYRSVKVLGEIPPVYAAASEMLDALKAVRPYVVEAAILDAGVGGRLALDKLDAVVAEAEGEAKQPAQAQPAERPHLLSRGEGLAEPAAAGSRMSWSSLRASRSAGAEQQNTQQPEQDRGQEQDGGMSM